MQSRITKKPSATITVNNKQLELPVYGGSVGPDVVDIRKLYAQTGVFTFDPGFTSTASCESQITMLMDESFNVGESHAPWRGNAQAAFVHMQHQTAPAEIKAIFDDAAADLDVAGFRRRRRRGEAEQRQLLGRVHAKAPNRSWAG